MNTTSSSNSASLKSQTSPIQWTTQRKVTDTEHQLDPQVSGGLSGPGISTTCPEISRDSGRTQNTYMTTEKVLKCEQRFHSFHQGSNDRIVLNETQCVLWLSLTGSSSSPQCCQKLGDGAGGEEAAGAQNSALAIQATAPYPALCPSPATPVINRLFRPSHMVYPYLKVSVSAVAVEGSISHPHLIWHSSCLQVLLPAAPSWLIYALFQWQVQMKPLSLTPKLSLHQTYGLSSHSKRLVSQHLHTQIGHPVVLPKVLQMGMASKLRPYYLRHTLDPGWNDVSGDCVKMIRGDREVGGGVEDPKSAKSWKLLSVLLSTWQFQCHSTCGLRQVPIANYHWSVKM